MPRWAWIIPLLALVTFAAGFLLPAHSLVALLLFAALLGR